VSTASRGASREHAVKKLLEAEGWAVTRGAGSHGCADLWAAKEHQLTDLSAVTLLRLVQVKGNTGSPWKTFQPKDRAELSSLAAQTGGTAELVHWPPHGKPRWYSEHEWPQSAMLNGHAKR
jgi:hypothetical protein